MSERSIHRDAARRAAGAAARRALASGKGNDTRPRYAIITSVDPLEADLSGTSLTLDADDLVLCQQVRQYDAQYGLEDGDALVVTEMINGDWLASAVVSEKDVTAYMEQP